MDRRESGSVTEQPPDLDQNGQPVGAPPDLDASGKPVERLALPIGAPSEPGTFQGGFSKSIRDTVSRTGTGILHGLNPIPAIQSAWNNGTDALPYKPEDTPATAMARLKAHDAPSGASAMESMKGLSDPETGGQAIGNLLQAGVLGRIVSGAQNPGVRRIVGRGMQTVGDNVDVTKPLKMLSTAGRALEESATPQVEPPTGPTGPHLDRSVPMRPGGMTPQQIGERLQFGTGTPPVAAPKSPLGGRMPMSPEPLQPIGRPPITVSPESPMQPPAPLTEWEDLQRRLDVGDARLAARRAAKATQTLMQQPRVQIGAEAVGRQQGLTKEAVRQQTGPILNEAPGEASPVFPQKPFERMHDTLKGLPKGSAEREAYVRAAADPKTAGLLETIRRTLERNGLAIGGTTLMGDAMRRAILSKLTNAGSDQQE